MTDTNGKLKIPNWVAQAILGALLGLLISSVIALASAVNSHGNRITKQETVSESFQKQLDRIEAKLDKALK